MAAVVAGCEGPVVSDARGPGDAAPAAGRSQAYSHRLEGDVSGYYLPASQVAVGGYRLTRVFLGQASAFQKWEAGRHDAAFAPIMVELESVDGRTLTVLPTTYDVTDSRIRFAGRAEGVGEVTVQGGLDQEALATARRNLGEEAPAMTLSVQIGGRRFGHQKFRWYGGD